jgi:hypothetical protein
VGRTGYYGREHVARLLLVREMLAEGYGLAMIERTLAHAPHTASSATLALHRALLTPWLPPEPEETTAAELAERAGLSPTRRWSTSWWRSGSSRSWTTAGCGCSTPLC